MSKKLKFVISVRDILRGKYIKWEDVKKSIKYHYPADKSNYEDLFYKLGRKRFKQTGKGETLVVHGGMDYSQDYYQDNKGEPYLGWIKDGTDFQGYSVSIDKEEDCIYSCSFVDWATMVNLPINPKTFEHITMIDIVAHFIWEITFYGPEDVMNKEKKKLDGMCANLKGMTEDELSDNTISMDEMEKKLGMK